MDNNGEVDCGLHILNDYDVSICVPIFGRFPQHLAGGALPKFEGLYATPFLLRIALCEQAHSAMHNKKSLAVARLSNFGWKMGFEPTTFGTTIRHSNRLSYIHHVG